VVFKVENALHLYVGDNKFVTVADGDFVDSEEESESDYDESEEESEDECDEIYEQERTRYLNRKF
jgi:hypothetical protein